MKKIGFEDVELTGGFFFDRQSTNRDVTIYSVRDRFADTGRFNALRFEWKQGEPDKPHIFWDSDVAKWIESVAFIIQKQPAPELEMYVDGLVDLIEKNQCEDGYFNSYFTVIEPENRFTVRGAHELYCAGHLIEAAVAYSKATGKRKLLDLMVKYIDCIERAFITEKTAEFTSPGHEEIELALIKLYEYTGEKRYLELAMHFIDVRGTTDEGYAYDQSDVPVRSQQEAYGHSVRACYLYSAMADAARLTKDSELLAACRAIFRNITEKRMYITGGIGSTRDGERFTMDYDLPDSEAYAETCAAISLCYFSQRMLMLDADSRYADTVERTLFNGILSGVSLDGKSFFYENPLEINMFERASNASGGHKVKYPITQRVEVFECSCCPPNITRLLASVGDYIYTTDDDTLYVHQYFANTAKVNGAQVCLNTDYPRSGRIELSVSGGGFKNVALRIPSWCSSYSVYYEAEKITVAAETGYVYIPLYGDAEIVLELDMTPQVMVSHPAVFRHAGKGAVMRGPIVYCAEAVDNGSLEGTALSLPLHYTQEYEPEFGAVCMNVRCVRYVQEQLYCPVQSRTVRDNTVHLIPYYAFANRGESDMKVYLQLAME